MSKDSLIRVIDTALNAWGDTYMGNLTKAEYIANTIRQHYAEQEVLRVRGSYDAPGFDACVKAELQSMGDAATCKGAEGVNLCHELSSPTQTLNCCPHCGGEAEYGFNSSHDANAQPCHYVICQDCPANMEAFNTTKEYVVAAWNKRAPVIEREISVIEDPNPPATLSMGSAYIQAGLRLIEVAGKEYEKTQYDLTEIITNFPKREEGHHG